jgi:hypothetical protein
VTPERELQLRSNIFEMWFELLRRTFERQCDYYPLGIPEQLESELKILEESKETLKQNFIKHYHLSDEIKKREV